MKIKGLIKSKLGTPIFSVYSTARPGVIKEHVRKFLMYEATVYGDTTFIEFTDEFLSEHVKAVCVCDTEMVSKDRQVS